MDLYLVEVEVIKKVFKSKESMVEEMKKEIEMMKYLVKDVYDKKSFWIFVLFIIIFFMVVFVVYVVVIK